MPGARVDHRHRTGSYAALVVASLASAACVYDSPLARAKSSQRAVANAQTPQTLVATEKPHDLSNAPLEVPDPKRDVHVLKLRARATAQFAAQNLDWPRRVEAMVARANELLAPTLGVRVVVVETTPWKLDTGDADLAVAVRELAKIDRADDVDWTMGLVGTVPAFTTSFHQLGFGQVLGKHVVLRAVPSAQELDAIRADLKDIGEEERDRLYRARMEHKETAVFLHEIGHTLGAVHESESTTIMSPTYDPKETSFSGEAATLMRLALANRLAPAPERDERKLAEGLLNELEKAPGPWVPKDKAEMVSLMKRIIATGAAATGSTPAPSASGSATASAAATQFFVKDLEQLSPSDRTAFDDATRLQAEGHVVEAWAAVQRLFSAYPSSEPVQDLRCRLAMERKLAWDVTRRECDGLMRLTPGLKRQPPAR